MSSFALIVARRALRCGSASASANTPTRQIIGSVSSALSQSCRCMSITSQYEKGLGLLNRLPQKQPAASNPGPLVTNGANSLNAKGSGKATANSNDATANAGQASSDTNLPAVVPQQHTAVAEHPAADDVSLLGSTPKQIAEQVAHGEYVPIRCTWPIGDPDVSLSCHVAVGDDLRSHGLWWYR